MINYKKLVNSQMLADCFGKAHVLAVARELEEVKLLSQQGNLRPIQAALMLYATASTRRAAEVRERIETLGFIRDGRGLLFIDDLAEILYSPELIRKVEQIYIAQRNDYASIVFLQGKETIVASYHTGGAIDEKVKIHVVLSKSFLYDLHHEIYSKEAKTKN